MAITVPSDPLVDAANAQLAEIVRKCYCWIGHSVLLWFEFLESQRSIHDRFCQVDLESTPLLGCNLAMQNRDLGNVGARQIDRRETYTILIGGTILAFLLRYTLRGFESGDYTYFTSVWYDQIREEGAVGALRNSITNYTPFYTYLMIVAHPLFAPMPDVFAIKLISIVFDCVCAVFVYKIVHLKYTVDVVPAFAYIATLFAPTVLVNSALWGQVDIIYTTGVVACVYFLLSGKERLAFLAIGLGISFKLQAAFLVPALLTLLLKRRISWTSLLIIPAVYVAMIVPAWLAGRPLSDLLLIYFGQFQSNPYLTLNAPNVYQWFPNGIYDILYPAGLVGALSLVFVLCLLVYTSNTEITPDIIVALATISLLLMPYVLPKMHERYFFPADVMSIVLAFYCPRYFYVPVVIGMVSLFSYFPFLFGLEFVVIPLPHLALVLLAPIVILARHLTWMLHPSTMHTLSR